MLTSSLGWLIIKIRTNNSRIGNKEVIHMEKKVYVELPPFTGRNVPITEIAAAMHKDAQYAHWFAAGNPEIGYAIKLENSNEYNYYCPDRKVWRKLILPAGNRAKELSSWQMRTLGGQYKRQLPCDYHSARIL